MTRLLTAFFLFSSISAVADDLRTFSDGQVIEADDFNHNFQKLEQDIADIPEGPQGPMGNPGNPGPAGPVGPAGADGVVNGVTCTTDQIVRYDGNAWSCVDDPFAGLNCDVGDKLIFTSDGWGCVSAPITASLASESWALNSSFGSITAFFDNISGISSNSSCDMNTPNVQCNVIVTQVVDHRNCIVNISGGAVSGNGSITPIQKESSSLRIGDLSTWVIGDPIHINISCLFGG